MDRDKVIEGFELFIKGFELFIKETPSVCTGEGAELDMFRNVLELLKEQKDQQSGMKEYYDWDDGCYEKVTHSNELAQNLHEVQHLCNIAQKKTKRVNIQKK